MKDRDETHLIRFKQSDNTVNKHLTSIATNLTWGRGMQPQQDMDDGFQNQNQ